MQPFHAQPAHTVVVMEPASGLVHLPFPGMFMPPPGHPVMQMAPPSFHGPMMVPHMPKMDEVMSGQVFVPCLRPQGPAGFSCPGHEEEVAPPTPLPPSANMPLQVTAAGKRVKVSCPRFEARCTRISYAANGERIVLEGKVRLTFRGRDGGKVSAERVEVDVHDGTVEVNPAMPESRAVLPVGYSIPVSRYAEPAKLRMAPVEP